MRSTPCFEVGVLGPSLAGKQPKTATNMYILVSPVQAHGTVSEHRSACSMGRSLREGNEKKERVLVSSGLVKSCFLGSSLGAALGPGVLWEHPGGPQEAHGGPWWPVTLRYRSWVGLMGGFYILVFGDRTGKRYEMALGSVSRGNFGRFMEHCSSRGRW